MEQELSLDEPARRRRHPGGTRWPLPAHRTRTRSQHRNPGAYHWFVGDGMVHGVRLQGGRALWYRNRWIRSRAVSAALKEPACPGVRHGGSDTVNTNVLGHAGKTWALRGGGRFPGGDRATWPPWPTTRSAARCTAPSAPIRTGTRTPEKCTPSATRGAIQTTVRHVVVDRDGRVRREEPIAVAHGPSIHDCMITPSYHVLVFDLPVTFLPQDLAGRACRFRTHGTRNTVPGWACCRARAGAATSSGATVDPCYVFHPCNAFETDDGRVIVDVVSPRDACSPTARRALTPECGVRALDHRPGGAFGCSAVCWTPSRRSFRAATSGFLASRTGMPTACRWTRDDAALGGKTYLLKHDLHTGGRRA
jgi:carotenoid cleavage dioxygenase-like enzyme